MKAVFGILVLVFTLLAATGIVWLFGGTFGQRCDRAFRNDPVEQEACVMRLNRGGPVYRQNEGSSHD